MSNLVNTSLCIDLASRSVVTLVQATIRVSEREALLAAIFFLQN